MKRSRVIVVVVAVLFNLSAAKHVGAEVVDSSAQGFTSRNSVTVNAPAKDVYRHFVTNIGQWWNAEHTYSGSSQNLSIEPRAGGCFCEKLKDGGNIEHLRVVYVDPDRIIRLTGGLGPLQQMAVMGTLTVTMTRVEQATRVEWLYTVGGYNPKGFQGLAPLVDSVLLLQLNRLKNYSETGKP